MVRGALLFSLFVAQCGLAWLLRDEKPHWDILPPAPSERSLKALAFGDPEFLYRVLVLDLQNFGDTGGRNTPLRNYNMPTVVAWLRALDTLDYRANHHVTLAAQYFSQTQDVSQTRYLVDYLREHVARDPAEKIQWLTSALHIARVRLNDEPLVLAIADQLAGYDFPNMSIVAYQLPAAIYERSGNFDQAADYMELALQRLRGRVNDHEVKIMEGYVTEMRHRATTQ